MKKIKNVSQVKLTVHGTGVFEPGEIKEVEDSLADQLKLCTEFEIVEDIKEIENEREPAKRELSSEYDLPFSNRQGKRKKQDPK